jgi:putative peptidoglycan lipid II flippase
MSFSPVIEKKQSFLRATSLVSLLTFCSRMFGFVRDMLLAQLFGAQEGMDAFYLAFRIPNFMRRLFAEGAFSQAFVPVLAEYQQKRSFDEVRQFLARVSGCLGLALLTMTLIGMLGSPVVIKIFAPGFKAGGVRAEWAATMLRITFPYLMFISLTAMAGAVLNTYGYFGVPAFTPVILNIVMIATALWGKHYMTPAVFALAWGVCAAGIFQFLLQLPFLYKKNLLVPVQVKWSDPGVKRVLKLMVPALFGVSVAQVNLLIDTMFASFLPIGSVTWLYYTDRLTDFPLGVFGVAIATVILPHLSRKHAENHHERFAQTLDWGIRMILLIGVPAGVGLTVFAMPLVATCFGYGAFHLSDITQTQKSLMTLGIGVPAFMLVKVLASGFYSKQNIKTPVKIGALAMIVNSILCALFIFPLKHAGLTLASSLAGYFNAGTLLFLLYRRKIYVPQPGWSKFFGQLTIANLVMSLYLWWGQNQLTYWYQLHLSHRLLVLLLHVVMALIIYVVVLLGLGFKWQQFRGLGRE